MVDFDKKWQFLVGNMCNPARRTPGTAEREASVAEMLASEARHPLRAGGRGGARFPRTKTLLYAFSRAIDRESLAGLGNSLKLLLDVTQTDRTFIS